MLSIILSACTTVYDRKDIYDYVKENYDIHDFIVDEEYQEITGEDGYTDKLWNVQDEEGITFHVLDDFAYSGESVKNRLYDDYDDALFKDAYRSMNHSQYITYKENVVDGLTSVSLTGEFTDRQSLYNCYEALRSYQKQLQENDQNMDVYYQLSFLHPVLKIGDYENESGNSSGTLGEINADTYEQMLFHYYRAALSFQLEDNTAEMTDEEIRMVTEEETTHRIFITYDDGSIKKYEDIIADPYYYGISYGALYKILVEENFDVEGNSNHYTVHVDDTIYEISYDFRENDHYYYLKNGVPVYREYYFYNCFECEQIEDMFGLKLEEKENRFIE